jgi:hypothetical protein
MQMFVKLETAIKKINFLSENLLPVPDEYACQWSVCVGRVHMCA